MAYWLELSRSEARSEEFLWASHAGSKGPSSWVGHLPLLAQVIAKSWIGLELAPIREAGTSDGG